MPWVRVEGQAGELRVGYQKAARLLRWRLELQPQRPRRYALTADVMVLSEHWMSYGEFDVVLENGPVAWCWRRVAPAVAGDRLTLMVADMPEVVAGAGVAG